jgi:hypothetical protein
MLLRNNQLPEAPASLDNAELEISYTSPASQSQFASRLTDISAFLRDITPLAQVKPEIMQAIDERELFEDYAKYRNISPTVIKSQQTLDEEASAQAEQEQQMQMAQAAPQISGAMKDIAQARATDPEGVGQLLNI